MVTGAASAHHDPQVLVPYGGPEPDPAYLDVFVYLRPESNGVEVESAVLSVIQHCAEYRSGINLIYLANVPGDYIVRNRIIERHYATRLFFGVHGGSAFSSDMKRQFELFYGVPFEQDRVIGAFEALRRFEWDPEELFRLWVENDALVHIAGQNIKRYNGIYIVNYDVPALLHKNNAGTDIAVMAFRTREGYPHFFHLAHQMRSTLVERGLLRQGVPIARAVHISRSPFEQLIDTRDYLIRQDGSPATPADSSFGRYLLDRAVPLAVVQGFMDHPICEFDFGEGLPRDQSLLELCEGFNYEDCLHMLPMIRSQLTAPGSPFL
ncbi:MAG: hypothetical protein EA427_12965 [Spirochaetaceae bacterium]|nr:MAG: hypothetical protein EA427_12965 [Spirochaetaceae bacterium]